VRLRLLVGAEEFWESLAADLGAATEYAFVQTLSLEGDRAGMALAGALQDAACRDRRILVDSFTKVILSDRFRFTPAGLVNRALRAEGRATARMIRDARSAGIGVRFTNPLGPLLLRFPARNHKKLVVIDDRVSYVGGINFSDHNFAWHDLMLRIEDPEVAAFLRDDFLATWGGENLARARAFDGLELHTFDGRSNAPAFAALLDLLDGAREEIFVESPYLSFPFLGRLAAARRRGVRVTLVSPGDNNHASLRRYAISQSAEHGFDLHLSEGRMSHLKAMLIDGRWLVLGSSNFDWLSYYLHQDVVAVVTDQDLIAEFQARVLAPDVADATRHDGRAGALAGRATHLQLRSIAAASRLARRLADALD
jgi:cardiolipin synthase